MRLHIFRLAATQVREAKRLRVAEVSVKEERKQRPAGLNTVELLKVGACVPHAGLAHVSAPWHAACAGQLRCGR